ncbi:anthranilate synthase component I [Halovivax asiaticus JCM 14624]|uniref:Anthranilate synthase component 1 n=1 Tax=Halovivax asiaticus JCM 14624 TaxID=1227490 RepID=M0BFK5_9EURY|nr:anthranilate synthase component I [Halovivax asiaticus]ELZ08434.1 anthranilate synthase component I [Halovivax asiaticus JCM 14624]
MTEPQLSLDRASFVDLAEAAGERPVIVRTEAELDVETTPMAAYAALSGRSATPMAANASVSEREDRYAFLLESAEKTASSDPDGAFRPTDATGARHARFSYVGYDPDAVVTVTPDGTSVEALSPDAPVELVETDASGDVVDALRAAVPDVTLANPPARDRQHLDGGLVGFLAYDAVYDLWLDDVGVDRPESPVPDAQFLLTTKTLAFDERDGTLSLVFTPIVEADDDPGAIYDNLRREATRVADTLADAEGPKTGGFVSTGERAGDRADYEAVVQRVKAHVLDGDIYQGVVSRTRELAGEIDPLALYESLRECNPSPYMYLLDHGDRTVVGASPETLVSVHDERVEANPIAGTCDRGATPVEDRRLAGELLADDKERAEHTMLVDLARNDVRRVSEPGSVRVEEFMTVRKYSHVQHIESTVTGELASGADAFDATRATFPAGTLAGAPKIRAMELIHDLEERPRGLYGGGVGYYSWTGDADFAIAIRTATIDHDATVPSELDSDPERRHVDDGGCDRVTVRAGAGLVADSDPASEFEETEQKMGGVLEAIERITADPPGDESIATDSPGRSLEANR